MNGWVDASMAHAADVVITCDTKGTVSWSSPGIGKEPAVVEWQTENELSNCKGSVPGKDGVVPIRVTVKGTEKASCDGEVTDHKGKGTISWSDKTTSKFDEGEISESKSGGSGDGDFSETIKSGTMKGHTMEVKTTGTDSGHPCPGERKAELEGMLSIS